MLALKKMAKYFLKLCKTLRVSAFEKRGQFGIYSSWKPWISVWGGIRTRDHTIQMPYPLDQIFLQSHFKKNSNTFSILVFCSVASSKHQEFFWKVVNQLFHFSRELVNRFEWNFRKFSRKYIIFQNIKEFSTRKLFGRKLKYVH